MTDPIEWPSAFEIPDAKLTRFLLDVNGRKPDHARWFIAQGFDPGEPEALADTLFAHAIRENLTKVISDAFGLRYVFEGSIDRWSSTGPWIRSIWMIEHANRARTAGFVTAYPINRPRARP